MIDLRLTASVRQFAFGNHQLDVTVCALQYFDRLLVAYIAVEHLPVDGQYLIANLQ